MLLHWLGLGASAHNCLRYAAAGGRNAWGRVQRQPGCIECMPWHREWRLAPESKPVYVHPSCTPQEFAAYRHEDRLVISTGSATGAYSALSASDGGRQPTPSFALMDVDGSKVRGGPEVRHSVHPLQARHACT